MLTQDELRNLNITQTIADQGFEQVNARLQWALGIRRQIVERAINLLKIFLTLALAVVSVGAALVRSSDFEMAFWPFLLGLSPLYVASACMAGALVDRAQGSLGSSAEWWLRRGVIDGDEVEKAYLTACLIHNMEGRVKASANSNAISIRFIRYGICVALLTPIALLLAV